MTAAGCDTERAVLPFYTNAPEEQVCTNRKRLSGCQSLGWGTFLARWKYWKYSIYWLYCLCICSAHQTMHLNG